MAVFECRHRVGGLARRTYSMCKLKISIFAATLGVALVISALAP
jgi:hypothetical protein